MSFPRYPEYKDSGVEWLGEVPVHWDVTRLRYVISSIESGTSVNATDLPAEEGEVGVLKTSCVYRGYFEPIENKRVVSEELDRVSCPLKKDALIVSRMNTPDLIGAAGLVDFVVDGIYLPDRLWQISFDKNALPSFMHLWASSAIYRAQVQVACAGTSSSMQNLSQDNFKGFMLALPPQHEQADISAFLKVELRRVDDLISEQEKLIALLKEERQAVISHAVTKGLNPNVPMKDSGIEWLGEVPAHWEIMPLKYFASFSGGGTPSRDNLSYWNGDIPWVSPKDMKVERIVGAEECITELGLVSSSSSLLPAGRVLMVVRSGILQHTIPVAVNNVPVSLNQDMKAILFKEKVCMSDFFLRWVQGLNDVLLLAWAKQGATVESIEQEYLSNTYFPLPPMYEQREINDFIDKGTAFIDELMAEATHGISLLKERRSALISAAVTGKIDVRQYKAKEVA